MQDCPFMTHIFFGNGGAAKVDPADWLLYAGRHWYKGKSSSGWYAVTQNLTSGRPRKLYLHRLIAKCPRGMVTHHIDGDNFNCHRANLQNMSPNEHVDLHKFRKISRRK